jgi:anthraniloyl-CoA monooxygenase
MKIDCVGAGPGSLYFALLAKLRSPRSRLRVFERCPVDHFSGWGVVLDQDIRSTLGAADPQSAAAIDGCLYRWDTIDIVHRGRRFSSRGHAFGCISRSQLLAILRERCVQLGVELHDGHPVQNADELDADLVVAGDGVRSSIREQRAEHFGVQLVSGRNRFIWCGTARLFPHFTFAFQARERGWFWAQAYQYDTQHSTFIAECDEAALAALDLQGGGAEHTRAVLHEVFGELLSGATLEAGAPSEQLNWRRFQHLRCARWHWRNVVLLGDAAHTAHYSLGSGTKLALEDAIALARHVFARNDPLEQRLEGYEQERRPRVELVQQLAQRSDRWFEALPSFTDLDPEHFACALLMRTHFTGTVPGRDRLEKMLALARGGAAPRAGVGRLLRPLSVVAEGPGEAA